MNRKLQKNIYKDYIFNFLANFNLTHGIWMLYLAHKGLNLFQIGIMETIYHISSFTMEIPTGAIADIYGRKVSRIFGRVAIIIATLIMLYSDSVYFFALSFFFTALSNNLESGAGEALIYDSIKELGIEDSYTKIRGRNEVVFHITQILSLLLGGYIATKSYMSVYQSSLLLGIMSLIHSFFFTEPNIGKVKRKENHFATFIQQLKNSFLIVKKERRVVEVILLLELFSTFFTTEFFYIQNRLKSLGLTEFNIGIVLAAGSVSAAIFSSQTYKLEKKFSFKTLITSLALLAIISFWFMSISGMERFAFVALATIEGILYVTLGDYINRLIPSAQRATILSMQSMVFSFFMIILFPIIGKIGDIYSLQVGFRLIAIVSTIALGFMIVIIQKGNHKKE